MSVTGTDSDSAPPTLDMRDNEDGNDSNAEGSSLYQPSLAQRSQEGFGNSGSSFNDVTATTVGEKVSEHGIVDFGSTYSLCIGTMATILTSQPYPQVPGWQEQEMESQ
jgi:hypothetical protein